MYYYRITKYNPKYRNEKDWYTRNEWTSISDVDRSYNGELFTITEYKRIEDLYIKSVFLFMACLKIQTLKCSYIEKDLKIDDKDYPKEWKELYKRINKGLVVEGRSLIILLKMILRELLWCKLVYNNKMFVHFGYDYYMYVGIEKECKEAVDQINQSGLFVEEFISPYLNEED